MIDTTIPEVKEALEMIKTQTGLSEVQLMSIYENSKIKYVRFKEGELKGRVGYYYYIPFPRETWQEHMWMNVNPYSREVYLSDGKQIVLTMGWDSSFEHITEEEYLKECEVNTDD